MSKKQNLQEDIIMNEENLSMADFEEEIEKSFKRLRYGDIVKGTVTGTTDTQVNVDLGSYSEGIISLDELSNDPRFSIMTDIKAGDEISAMVLGEDAQGNILLSKKQAEDILSWEILEEYMKNKTICTVKIAQAVNAGVVTYLNGIRAFIPASQLALEYVENLDEYVGKKLEVNVIEVNQDDNKLILSAKEPAREKALADKNSRISKMQIGIILNGTVEKIMPYGAFIDLGEDLSGLVHISQICEKRIKSPKEVIKEGDKVTVKVIDVKDGKISLSMKAAMEKEEVFEDIQEAPMEYTSGEEASTNLGALLSRLKIQ